MNRNLKLALAALLGFSAACSSVKNAPRKEDAKRQDVDTTAVKGYSEFPRRVVVMYGVPTPHRDSIHNERLKRLERGRPDSLPPVAERPQEEDPSVDTK
ncbi:hypothetical protein [Alistipes sp.]|uniref:hypothetical protein n=1 Tax=Alistipes sp. TaxID=1872444 RepID=UPI0025C6B03B|nr:hypothetical protein [Alistipes sp.]